MWYCNKDFRTIEVSAMKKLILILTLCFGFVLSTQAQSLSNKERRIINHMALNTIEQYEFFMELKTKEAQDGFRDLFDSYNVMIYNDILGVYSPNNKISLNRYIEHLSKAKYITAKIKNISKIKTEWRNDSWHIIVSFQKSMNYIDNNYILFSSQEYYRTDYNIIMDLRYDSSDKCCYISGIDGNIRSTADPLPRKFVVLDRSSEELYKRWFNKYPASYNSRNQAFVPSWKNEDINEVDIIVNNKTIAATENYQYLKLGYKTTHGRAKIRFGYAPMAYNVVSPYNFSEKSSWAIETTADIGYTVKLGKNSSMGLFAGVGISHSSLSLQLDNINYDCNVGGISDSSKTSKSTRSYSISASESFTFTDLVVPAYIGFEHKLTDLVSLVWSVGAKMYTNLNTFINTFYTSGTIKQGDEILNLNKGFTKFVYPGKYTAAEPFSLASLSGTVTAGVNFNIYKHRIFVNTSVGYEQGLVPINNSSNNTFFNKDYNIYPLVPSGADINKNVATRSFVDCISIYRQALWIEAGLMFKF